MEYSPAERAAEVEAGEKKDGFFKKALSIIRFSSFIALLGAVANNVIPEASRPDFRQPLVLAGALLAGLVLFLLIYFLIFGKRGGMEVKTAINMEAVAALIIGMIALVVFGVYAILVSRASPLILLVIFLVLAAVYYFYSLLRETLAITSENLDIRKKYRELVKIDREKSDFMNVTSHQLRTPLTEMRWSLEKVLQDPAMSAESKSIIERSVGSVKRLGAIVEDLLKARVLEDGATDGKNEPIDLGMLVRGIIDELRDAAKQNEVEVVFNPFEQTITVMGDQAELRGAIKNVIDNAIRYSPKKTVTVSMAADRKTAQVRVEDTGIGIDMEDYGRVFQKFFRGKNAMLVQPNGSGIGLYTTKRIIERCGGNINFFSQFGKGTIFMLVLPRKL